jgi:hypothetical protein
MPGKSKHGKGRRNQYRSKPAQPKAAVTAASSNTAPAAQAALPASPAMVKPVAPPKTNIYKPATTAEYPYFSSELKRILILTAAIVVVLIVLAIIFK